MSDENSLTMGQLRLPKDVGLGESEASAIEARWDTLNSVNRRLQELGMREEKVPDIACPIVTAEALTDPNVQNYTVLYASQLRWYNHVTRLLASIRAGLLQVEVAMDDIESSKRIHFREMDQGKKDKDKMSATEMKDLIFQDPRYRDLKLEWLQLEQMRLQVDGWAEGLDRSLKTISRQIENRKTENDGGRREANMPGHATGAWDRNTRPTW